MIGGTRCCPQHLHTCASETDIICRLLYPQTYIAPRVGCWAQSYLQFASAFSDVPTVYSRYWRDTVERRECERRRRPRASSCVSGLSRRRELTYRERSWHLSLRATVDRDNRQSRKQEEGRHHRVRMRFCSRFLNCTQSFRLGRART